MKLEQRWNLVARKFSNKKYAGAAFEAFDCKNILLPTQAKARSIPESALFLFLPGFAFRGVSRN